MLADLAPHMINLNQGRFSRAGATTTDPGDVEAIFQQHLPAALEVARLEKRPLHVVFYAHGGLVGEAAGIGVAHKHVSWWKANGVYPIYFTWETGLIETFRALLPFGGQRGLPGARDLTELADRTVERLVHAPGEKVWGNMKRSAERSVDPIPTAGGQPEPREGGGARYAADLLAGFLKAPASAGVPVELHAVGHSAGAIFHSWFVPAALAAGSGPFTSTHLMAPAITVDGFTRRLAGPMGGQQLGRTTLYTMKKAMELADRCGPVYHKSLLYLIHFALEPEREEPILGLEVSLRADRSLKKLFGLDGGSGAPGEVVWSETPSSDGKSASRSTTHGGFDDDVPTMDSILRRVLDVGDGGAIQSFAKFKPAAGRGLDDDPWTAPSPREAEILALMQPAVSEASSAFPAASAVPSSFSSASASPPVSFAGAGEGGGGARSVSGSTAIPRLRSAAAWATRGCGRTRW